MGGSVLKAQSCLFWETMQMDGEAKTSRKRLVWVEIVLALSNYKKVPFHVFNSESAFNSHLLASFSTFMKRSMYEYLPQ